jgi:hypothetical protein
LDFKFIYPFDIGPGRRSMGFRLCARPKRSALGALQGFASAGTHEARFSLLYREESQKGRKPKAKGTGEKKEKSNQRLTVGQIRLAKTAFYTLATLLWFLCLVHAP